MATIIHSNGSKWAGQQPDPIEAFIERLKTETLDPTFEQYGDFIDHDPRNTAGNLVVDQGQVRFFGNFCTVSGVFCIDTDDAELIATLTELIAANKATPAYAQEKLDNLERKRIAEQRAIEKRDREGADRVAHARRVLEMQSETGK